MTTSSYTIEGLTCGACLAEVMERVRLIPRVTGVSIDLVRNGLSPLLIRSDGALPGDAVAGSVEPAGFHVASTTAHPSGHLQRILTGIGHQIPPARDKVDSEELGRRVES